MAQYCSYSDRYIVHIIFVADILRAVGVFFFFQAEDGIRDLVRSRGLGDVYKRQIQFHQDLPHRAQRSVGFEKVRRFDERQRIMQRMSLSLIHI